MATEESNTKSESGLNRPMLPNFVLLSSAFREISLFRPNKPNLVNAAASNVVLNFQQSLDSVTDMFFKSLSSLFSRNPLLRKAASLPAEFHALCHQVRSRNSVSVKFPLSYHGFAAVLGGSVAGTVVADGLMNFLNLYNTLLVVRLVLTWFPNTPPAIVSPLSTLCDPYLNIFRGLIPPLGGTLDLSPILAFLVLNAFTSTAAALPCELPLSDGPGPSETKWMRRRRLSNKSHAESSSGMNQ